MKWDEFTWSKSPDQPTMLTKHLLAFRGWRLDLHKMIGADAPDCLHTHPAIALRVILWGGYCEEFIGPDGKVRMFRALLPFTASLVRPELAHRIESLLNGQSSYTLWLRGPKVAEVQLVGEGWEDRHG